MSYPKAYVKQTRTITAFILAAFGLIAWRPSVARAQLSGELYTHDPSTVIYDAGRYYYFGTGDYLDVRSSSNLSSWTGEPQAFSSIPSWIPTAVPGYTGASLWAPDVIELNGVFHLYYAASVWGTKLSAIGHATSPTLDPNAANYGWTDQGMVISSNHSSPYNAIDPSLMLDDNTGRLWMTWGSFNNGIYVKELDPVTGDPLSSSPGVNVAAPSPTPEIEGAAMMQHNGYYYMFVNWGGCCSGANSTYNIRVGRSTSPTGPFLDRDGVNMLNDGGTLFLDDDGAKVGPGHFSFTDVGGTDMFSYHYYNADQLWYGDVTGRPTFGLRELYWTGDDWPSIAAVNPNWIGSAGSSWDQASNWTNSTVPNGIGHVANFASQSTGTHTVTLPGGRTVGTINFRGNSPYTIGTNAGPTITLNDVSGETATLNVAEGSHTIAAPISAVDDMGVNTSLSNSSLTLSGTVSAPQLSKYGDGELVLAGNTTISGNVYVKNGTLTIGGAGQVNVGSAVHIGYASSDDNTLNLDGGTLTTLRITHDTASATVNFNGGVLRAGTSNRAFMQGLTNAYVQASGAVIDSQAYNITIGQSLTHDPALGSTHDGGLTKQGAGTLTLSAASTYTGDTNIEAGTLALTSGASIAQSKHITVQPGATLDVSALGSGLTLQGGQTLTNNSNTTVVGDVVAGSGATVNGSGTFANNLTMQDGSTLQVGGTVASTGVGLTITNGDFETGIIPPGDTDVDLWYDVNTTNGDTEFWTNAQHEQGLSPTANTGVLLGDGNGTIGGAIDVGGRWVYQDIGTKETGGSYTLSFDYGNSIDISSDRTVAIRAEVYQGNFPGAADDNDIADQGLTLITTLDSPGTSLTGEGNYASFSSPLDLSSANTTDPLWLRLSNLPGTGTTDVGSWVVIDNVDIQSTFTLPASAGDTMTVAGNLTLEAGSILALDIAGSGVNDLLNIDGNFTAGGTLEVSLDASAQTLSLGNSYDLLDFASAGGAFDNLLLPTLGSGLYWDTTGLLGTGVIRVVDSLDLQGDLNGDGYVGLDDLQLILDNWNMTVRDNHPADPSGDNYVGLDDLQPVLDHWNEGTPTSPQADIPEPTSLVLLGLGTGAFLSGRYNRRRYRDD